MVLFFWWTLLHKNRSQSGDWKHFLLPAEFSLKNIPIIWFPVEIFSPVGFLCFLSAPTGTLQWKTQYLHVVWRDIDQEQLANWITMVTVTCLVPGKRSDCSVHLHRASLHLHLHHVHPSSPPSSLFFLFSSAVNNNHGCQMFLLSWGCCQKQQ